MSNKYDFKRFSIGHGPDCGWIYDNTQKTEVAQVVDKSCWPLINDANAAEELRAQLAAAQKRIAELEAERAELVRAYTEKMYLAGACNDSMGNNAVCEDANKADDYFFALVVKIMQSLPSVNPQP